MRVIEAFLGEHGLLNAQIQHLEQQATESGVRRTDFRGQAEMLLAALRSHADLEEELLLSRLELHLGEHNSIVAVLRKQHEEIEVSLERILESDSPDGVLQLLQRVFDLVRDHFPREAQHFFPAAIEWLGNDVLLQLGDQWADRRGVILRQASE